jgi:hypothetical protein
MSVMTAPIPDDLEQPPRVLVSEACAAYGPAVIAGWCADLLLDQVAYDDPGLPSLTWLGGAHAEQELRKGHIRERGQDYWPRTWAARGLCYVWDPASIPAVVHALTDPAWRVREMAAKVARLREVGEAASELSALATDPVPRVRAAALRALGQVGEVEQVSAVRTAADDPEPTVQQAAETALTRLRQRLDRPL